MTPLFKVIIAGCRDFSDYTKVEETLNYILKEYPTNLTEIVSGGASGADRLGEQYAINKGTQFKVFKAQWDKYGKSAGPIRNREMAEYADALVAFWDGKSRGTKNMIVEAERNNIQYRIVYI